MILPDDVLPLIRAYSKPRWTRPDWRTCKRDEADHIYYENLDVMEMIPIRCISHDEVMDEVQHWTLFGKIWLLKAPEYKLMTHLRPPLIPPPDDMEDYDAWYTHQIQWLNG
jgi:hypothetical protein